MRQAALIASSRYVIRPSQQVEHEIVAVSRLPIAGLGRSRSPHRLSFASVQTYYRYALDTPLRVDSLVLGQFIDLGPRNTGRVTIAEKSGSERTNRGEIPAKSPFACKVAFLSSKHSKNLMTWKRLILSTPAKTVCIVIRFYKYICRCVDWGKHSWHTASPSALFLRAYMRINVKITH